MNPSNAQDVGEDFRVLFVCTGNTCRSPMAEIIARAHAASRSWDTIVVASAGVSAVDGAPASRGAVRAAKRRGLDLSDHRSRALTPGLVAWADLILTMTRRHAELAVAAGGDGKTALLGAYASGDEGGWHADVPDPFGGSDAEYEATFVALEDMVDRALARLEPILAP